MLWACNRQLTLYRAQPQPKGGGEGAKRWLVDALATNLPASVQEGSASVALRFNQPVMLTSHTIYIPREFCPGLRVRAGDKWEDDLGRSFRAEGWYDDAGAEDHFVCPANEIATFTT